MPWNAADWSQTGQVGWPTAPATQWQQTSEGLAYGLNLMWQQNKTIILFAAIIIIAVFIWRR